MSLSRLLCLLLIVLLLSSCGPTYPQEKLTASIIGLCKKEYGVDVSVQIAGKTLGIFFPTEKLLDSTLQFSDETRDKLDGVVLATSRIVLSTDFPLDFYVIVVQDTRLPGTELRFTRYVPDIKRFIYGGVARSDFTERMLFDIGIGFGGAGAEDGSVLEEVALEEFLASQIGRRIENRLREEAHRKQLEVRASRGRFSAYRAGVSDWGLSENRYGDFLFVLDVKSRGFGLNSALGEKEAKEAFETALSVITTVLHEYHFEAFDRVVIDLMGLERPLIIDREVLELYRRKKVPLDDLLPPTRFDLPPNDLKPLFNQ